MSNRIVVRTQNTNRPVDWLERRRQGVTVREALTDEWKERGIRGREYGILTREIAKATFGFSPAQHKRIKGLERQNLRDHMSGIEQLLTMVGEASAMEIMRAEDSQGFTGSRRAARRGGAIAGKTRRQLEAALGRPIVTSDNYVTGGRR